MSGRRGVANWFAPLPGGEEKTMIVTGTLWACALATTKSYSPPNLHKVGKNETFASISRRYNTGYERLMDANPEVKPEKLRPGTVIVIPGRVKQGAKALAPGTYRVTNGDTDWSVARRYDIKPSELRQMNPGVKWTALRPGTAIKVPVRQEPTIVASAEPVEQKPVVASKPLTIGQHKVTSDDNDWIIARGYGITPKRLRELNPGVDWNRLRPGSKLNVPVGSTEDKVAKITTKRAQVIKDNVLVRDGAKTDARRVTMVDYGRFATVADRIGSWYKLKFSGGTVGWVRGDLIRPVTASMVAQAERESGVRSIRRHASEEADNVARRRQEAETVVARREQPERRVARRETSEDTPRRKVTREATTNRTQRPARSTSSRPSAASRDEVVAMNDGERDGVVGTALSRLGTRYRWGGTTPSGFDCSGLTGYAYARNGKRLPRTAAEQATQGARIDRGGLKKGDLVFFRTTRSDRISHVGIYIGEGKFVHASSGGGKVRINNLSDSYYNKRFATARRPSGGGSDSSSSSASKKSSSKKSEKKEEEKPASDPKPETVADPKPKAKGIDEVGR